MHCHRWVQWGSSFLRFHTWVKVQGLSLCRRCSLRFRSFFSVIKHCVVLSCTLFRVIMQSHDSCSHLKAWTEQTRAFTFKGVLSSQRRSLKKTSSNHCFGQASRREGFQDISVIYRSQHSCLHGLWVCWMMCPRLILAFRQNNLLA